MEIKYIYDNFGTKAYGLESTDQLWLDNGSDIGVRVFDNDNGDNNSNKYKSSFSIINTEKDLVNKSIEQLKNNNKVFFHIHKNPDIDCLFSAFYFEKLLNNEDIEDAILKKMVDFVESIDSGKNKLIDKLTFYAIYSYADNEEVLNHYNVSKNLKDDFIKDFIFKNINTLINLLKENIEFDICNAEFPCEEEIRNIYLNIFKKQEEDYYADLSLRTLTIENIKMLDNNDKLVDVKSAIWNKLPKDKNSCYLLARKLDNVELTFTPQAECGNHRIIVSLNKGSNYSLLNFAKECEIWEQYYDYLEYLNTGKYKRNYNDSRNSKFSSIFSKSPFCETTDPWFIGNDYDIVDSPHSLSLIDYEKLCFIIENQTEKLCSVNILVNINQNSSEISFDDKEYFSCLDKVKDVINNTDFDGIIPVVKVKAKDNISELGYGMMDYFFAYINNIAIRDIDRNNVLRINNNLSIYVSQKFILVFNTIRSNSKENVELDSIVNEIIKITKERKTCLNIANKNLKNDIISLSVIKNEVIKIKNRLNSINQLKDMQVYNSCTFVKKCLNIDTLIESIINDIELNYNEKRDSFYEIFKPISLILAIIGFFNTVNSFTGMSLIDLRKIGQTINETNQTYSLLMFINDNRIELLFYIVPIIVVIIYALARMIKKHKI